MRREMTPPEGLRPGRILDRVTPELALVDPDLGEWVRSSLPGSDDTISRLELLVRAHRISASRERETVVRTAEPEETPTSDRDDASLPELPSRNAHTTQSRPPRRYGTSRLAAVAAS